MEVELEVVLAREREDQLSFREAVEVAGRVQERVLRFPGVVKADVHLETCEHVDDGKRRSITLRRNLSDQ
jgi:hypothetical protein